MNSNVMMPTQIANESLLLLLSNITVSGLVLHGGGDTTPLSILGDWNTVSSVLVVVIMVMMMMVMTVLMQIRDCVVEHHTAKTWVEMEGVGNTLAHCRSVSSVGEHSNNAQAAGSVRRQPCTRTREPTVTSSW